MQKVFEPSWEKSQDRVTTWMVELRTMEEPEMGYRSESQEQLEKMIVMKDRQWKHTDE